MSASVRKEISNSAWDFRRKLRIRFAVRSWETGKQINYSHASAPTNYRGKRTQAHRTRRTQDWDPFQSISFGKNGGCPTAKDSETTYVPVVTPRAPVITAHQRSGPNKQSWDYALRLRGPKPSPRLLITTHTIDSLPGSDSEASYRKTRYVNDRVATLRPIAFTDEESSFFFTSGLRAPASTLGTVLNGSSHIVSIEGSTASSS